MKAIETRYKGHRFRSRLEARWAVFFDAMGIDYRYEPEGFNLGGLWYLPDFYLPKEGMWIEVKPGNLTQDEYRKAYLFTDHIRKRNENLSDRYAAAYDEYMKSHDTSVDYEPPFLGKHWEYIILKGDVYHGQYEIETRDPIFINSAFEPRGDEFAQCYLCNHVFLTSRVDRWSGGEWDGYYVYFCECCDIGDCREASPLWHKHFHEGDIVAPIDPRQSWGLLGAFDRARGERFGT